MYISIEIERQPQLIIGYKINFQDRKFLIYFYSLSNELSNKSGVDLKPVYLFYLFLCHFVLDSNVRICIILKLLNKY